LLFALFIPCYTLGVTNNSGIYVILVLLIGVIAVTVLWSSEVVLPWKYILSSILAIADIMIIIFTCTK
jgi:hypothetical protein